MTTRAPVRLALKLYASLADYLPLEARQAHRAEIEVPVGTTVSDVIRQHRLPLKLCQLVLVNGVFVPPGERAARTLAENDELAIWPPIAGG